MQLSSRIKDYPGIEIRKEEIGKYHYYHYETVLKYAWSSGVAIGRFLQGLRMGEIWGRKCNKCNRILVPPRMYCEECFRANDEWVKLRDTGRVNTYSVSYVNVDASRRETPIIVSVIEIDGASPGMGILHILGDIDPRDVKIGMKVKAVWKPESERQGAITDILYFKPSE